MAEIKNGNTRAFPSMCEDESGKTLFNGEFGLTKREIFAAMVLQGYCSQAEDSTTPNHLEMARAAVSQADALLTALEKPQIAGDKQP